MRYNGSKKAVKREMNMEKNFWKVHQLSIFTVPYAYVDHSSYLADNLFAERKISVKFKGEMVREDSPYRIIFCRVMKRDAGRFEEALGKLENKMLLLGYRDYGKVCNEIDQVIGEREERKKP